MRSARINFCVWSVNEAGVEWLASRFGLGSVFWRRFATASFIQSDSHPLPYQLQLIQLQYKANKNKTSSRVSVKPDAICIVFRSFAYSLDDVRKVWANQIARASLFSSLCKRSGWVKRCFISMFKWLTRTSLWITEYIFYRFNVSVLDIDFKRELWKRDYSFSTDNQVSFSAYQ